ncbi:unnamed protein product [Peronospora destructor]|uniref:FYVE-type domain-containing protein n=1 Tax=Peronospora destructor TaxID=86335 RepID=A0AAV0V3I1_9STRA|nr:unnamed protein product [Peronospora destructor]
MDNSYQRHCRIPRPHFKSRGQRSSTAVAKNMVELETLAAFSGRTVALSQDESQVCSRLAELLLTDTLKNYDQMNRQVLSQQQWKLIKKKDQLGVYKQRKDTIKALSSTGGQCKTSETELPLLLVTGRLAGHVNDAMYGLVSANTQVMRMNSAYAGDSLEDAQVLTTIEGPTIEEPFRFLGLKWAVRHDAISASSFVKRRDLLYLEATGITKTTNGERVGYRVMHSVSIKALAKLAATTISSPVIRARASIVQLFHQQPSLEGSGGLSGTLNMFTRGYYDPQGGMMQFLAVNAGAELLLHMTLSVMDCAHFKKIAFAVQRAGRRQSAASQLHKTNYGDEGMGWIEEIDDEDAIDMGNKAWSTNCSLCDRRLGSLLNRSGVSCTICAQMVCWRCSVVKKLRFYVSDDSSMPVDNGVDLDEIMGMQHFEQPEASRASTERSSSGSGSVIMNDILQKSLKFCLPCVLRANHRNASQIVVEEILEQTTFGLVTPSRATDCSSNHSRPSSIRRRSTQTGQLHNLPQSSHGSNRFSHYAASPYCQPLHKAYSNVARVQHGVFRSTSASPRVMLYVEDPTR